MNNHMQHVLETVLRETISLVMIVEMAREQFCA